jgi:4-diphosphocytidyl-2-C-methyl-D-erythritol kinase
VTHVTPIRGPAGAVTARVPAKVNLQLSVGPLGADGYHELVTVFHAVALFDELTVRPAGRITVTVTGEGGPAVPLGPANLAVRAAAALARATGRRGQAAAGAAIEIRKRIPVAAGLAGGSADAAAALVACNELWRTGLSLRELCDIGAQIGSDVPFALIGGTAVGLGRGERLTTALVSGTYHWVLAFAASGLATPEVYAACDRLRAARAAAQSGGGSGGSGSGSGGPGGGRSGGLRDGGAGTSGRASGSSGGSAGGSGGSGPEVPAPRLNTELMAALRSGDPVAVGPLLSNDLQPAALSLQPLLRRALAVGRENGALGAIVSGSGPTCAFLAASAEQARELAVTITGAGVCRAVVQVTGPAAGASLVDGRGRE